MKQKGPWYPILLLAQKGPSRGPWNILINSQINEEEWRQISPDVLHWLGEKFDIFSQSPNEASMSSAFCFNLPVTFTAWIIQSRESWISHTWKGFLEQCFSHNSHLPDCGRITLCFVCSFLLGRAMISPEIHLLGTCSTLMYALLLCEWTFNNFFLTLHTEQWESC